MSIKKKPKEKGINPQIDEMTENQVDLPEDALSHLKEAYEEEIKKHFWEPDIIYVKEHWRKMNKIFLEIFRQKPRKRPKNLCVYAVTNTGKSTFFDMYIEGIRKIAGLHKYEIIQVSCDTNETLKGLYQSFLDELNWSYGKNDSIQWLEKTLKNAVRARKTRIFVIDEFSQIYEKQTSKGGYANTREALVLKALRNIPIHTLCPIVVIGIPTVKDLLDLDPETRNRFKKVEFPRFSLTKKEAGGFIDILMALESDIKSKTDIELNFSQKASKSKTLYEKSKGRLGVLVMIYQDILDAMIENGLDESDKRFETIVTDVLDRLREDGFFDEDLVEMPEIEEDWWKPYYLTNI